MAISIFILAACLVLLFSMDLSWSNLVGSRNQLVFDGRNQEFGAYKLRKEYHVNLFIALSTSLLLILGTLMFFKSTKGVVEATIPTVHDWIELGPIPVHEVKEKQKAEQQRGSQSKASGTQPTTVEVVTSTTTPQSASGIGKPDNGNETGDLETPVAAGCVNCNGTEKTAPDTTTKETVQPWARIMPEYPGGIEAMRKYLAGEVPYGELEREKGVEGTIFISFTISTSGIAQDIRIERMMPCGDRLAQKAVRAIENMPAWKPGSNGTRPVPVRQTVPLKFELKK